MATPKIKVLIVDDHRIVRIGLKSLLEDHDIINVVGEASDGEEAIRIARDQKPHVVLMDVKMPGIGGLEATRRLLHIDPDVKVIAVTVYGEEPFPSRLLQAGAAGYLTKEADLEEVVQAIRKVHAGQRYISPEIAQQLALKNLTSDGDPSPVKQLSERELQVMLMITQGQKVQAISDKLHLSPKTVNSYRYRLFDKLQVSTDVELTHLALRHGMLDSQEINPDLPSS